jgi:hypothetical protein
MADPYAGIGGGNDPYGGVGVQAPQPRDPYAGLGAAPPPPGPPKAAPAPQPAAPPASPGGSWWDNTVREAQNLRANFDQAVNTGPLMNGIPSPERVGMIVAGRMMGHPESGSTSQIPMGALPGDVPGVKDSMVELGIGRQPGESDASLNTRYNAALMRAKADAQSRMEATTMGSSGPGATLGQRAVRLAQQTGNVGAGIVANPQYFLAPGMAVGPNAAARIATSAAGNAAIGSASDAAAQLMDMANDEKKNFDIEQNLKSAMAGGVFGGAMHGAIEVAPHVKALFANRGMDTTPPADPTAADPIQPMTTDHIALNAADHMQLQQLIQTGSVDDIKGFFKGRQGPQPSWSSVNRFVEQRDNPNFTSDPKPIANPRDAGGQPFNYNDQYNQAFEDNYKATQQQAVQDHVDSITNGWKNAPNIEVVHGPADIADPGIRAQAMADDAPGKPTEGAPAFYGPDGTTRIYSGRASDPDAVTAAVYHEGLGHYGLAQKFGDKLDSVLNSMLGRNVNGLARDTTQWVNDHPGAYGGNRTRAAEEVLAEASEKGPLKASWKDALSATMNQFGRRMGIDLSYSDGEIRHILSQAHNAVINGTDVRTNGFQGVPASGENKFQSPRNALGEEQTDPQNLSQVDRLKQDPRYWQDPEYRANVNEMARLQHPAEFAKPEAAPEYRSEADVRAATDNRFMSPKAVRDAIARPDYEPDDMAGIATHIEANYNKATVPWDQTREAALKLGISARDIRKSTVDNPGDLAAKVARIGAAADYAAARVSDIVSRLDTPDWKPEDHVSLAKALADRNYLIERFKGAMSEIGRALGVAKVFRQYSNGNIAELLDNLRDAGSGLGFLADPTNPEGLKFIRSLKQMLESGNPAGAQVKMQQAVSPYPEQYVNTFHMNAMLSALSTHVKAPIDMATGIIENVIEKAIALPIGKAREVVQTMRGATPGDAVSAAELINHTYGLLKAVSDMEVYRATLHAARTGESSYVVNGARTPTNFVNTYGALSSPRFGSQGSLPGDGVIGLMNKPTDLISAQDTLFRSADMNAQLLALGTREARADLGPRAPGRTWLEHEHDIMTLGHTKAMNPTISMRKEAFDLANRTLLLNDNPINKAINRLRIYTPGMNIGQRAVAFVTNFIAPFIRVESNSLLTRIIQRSPLGLIDPTGYTQAQLRAGGAKADIATARMLYGTAKFIGMWTAAGAGAALLTGNGPDNVDQFKEKEATGWRPNAVHENGKFNTGGELGMSLNPFDMHNSEAQMVASMRQAWEAGANKGQVVSGIMLALGSIFGNMAKQSWISDIAPTVDALTAHGQDAQTRVAGFAKNEAATLIPNALTQTSRLTDPNQRDISSDTNASPADRMGQSVMNQLKENIPGQRETLPIKYSVYGDPLANGASLTGVHTDIPGLSGNGTTETRDPAELELDKLNSQIPSIKAGLSKADAAQVPTTLITPVVRTFKLADGTTKTLTPEEYEQYQQRAGRGIVEGMRTLMSTPEWATMTDKDKINAVRGIESNQKYKAREELFEPDANTDDTNQPG